ncbi:MAG: hypothetical protein PHF67_00400 [Candidatus Nanoarchaeia archaeon]|nr:hypothetical protein [Candidatus Nanoarchaeia archaeon]
MRGYFCESNTGRYFLYVPFNLFAYDSLTRNEVNFRFDPSFLARMTLLLKEGKISREILEERNWDVYVVDIPDKRLKKLRKLCSKGKKMEKILKVSESIFRYCEDEFDEVNELESACEDEYDDVEDYTDDWWKRGDPPPLSQ